MEGGVSITFLATDRAVVSPTHQLKLLTNLVPISFSIIDIIRCTFYILFEDQDGDVIVIFSRVKKVETFVNARFYHSVSFSIDSYFEGWQEYILTFEAMGRRDSKSCSNHGSRTNPNLLFWKVEHHRIILSRWAILILSLIHI